MPATTKKPMPGVPNSGASPSAANSPGGTQPVRRTDAVAIEIPVAVHASRNSASLIEIAKSMPPVREETRTVIVFPVFPQGAVIRLTASLNTGEPVVLTNQRNGADVLCRVVSVKTQPGIQNYVELEFTQRAPRFWGDGFQTEGTPVCETAPSVTEPASLHLSLTPVPVMAPVPAPQPASHQPSHQPFQQPSNQRAVTRTETPATPQRSNLSSSSILGQSVLSLGVQGQGVLGQRSMPPPRAQRRGARLAEPRLGIEESSSRSKKLFVAAAAIVLLGAIAGGVVMFRQDRAARGIPQPASTTPSTAPSTTQDAPSSESLPIPQGFSAWPEEDVSTASTSSSCSRRRIHVA